jgi:type III pantothenate kinase
MLLACDIGNTNIKCGLFSDNILSDFSVLSSAEELKAIILSKGVNKIAVSSVVPGKLKIIKENLPPGVVLAEINKNSFFNLAVNYHTPETLGIDRLCSCEGAFYLYQISHTFSSFDKKTILVTVDLGTATTINFVSLPGIFEGGLISPGIQMMNNSLHSGTAQLPLADLNKFISVIGKDTQQSIAGGIITSTAGFIQRAVQQAKEELDADNAVVYFTGGNAPVIIPHINFEYTCEQALILYGINAVYNLNSSRDSILY